MIRVGLNGFGRIGRAVTRIITSRPDVSLVAVNELDNDLRNLAYLLKYDSIYGRFGKPVEVDPGRHALRIDGVAVPFYSQAEVAAVPWKTCGVDVVVEATGVDANARAAHDLVARGVPKVVITNAHPAAQATIILGVNEDRYVPARHHVVSSSICDANAITPVIFELDRRWGVEHCFITTLHPWLAYQNLLDGTVSSIASPGHTWTDYALGRSSVLSLIPKDTTAASATVAALPEMAGRVDAISFRVPTHIVSASDLSTVLRTETTAEEINEHFAGRARRRPDVFGYEEDHLVSIDYLGTTTSFVLDASRTRVLGGRFVKMVMWYDNEWGYSCRVVDVAKLVCGSPVLPLRP